jgi:hypothetical protein
VKNKKGFSMKFLMLALFAVASIVSVNANAKTMLVTEKVCNRGESGTDCVLVTYRVRPPSAPMVVKCSYGEGAEVQCPPAAWGIPAWLQKFNSLFPQQTPAEVEAAQQREIDQYQKAGG